MSSIATSKRLTKPTYLFIFHDEESASQFLAVANSYSNSSSAKHPYDRNKRCSVDKLRVLVIGCGSLIFDNAMMVALEAKAEELGGYYMPHT